MASPRCPYFGKCGGCTSQHIDYPAQLESKRKALASYTRFNDIRVYSGRDYEYRNRMDFIFHAGGLGFRERDRWDRIVDLEVCPISEPRINELLKEVRCEFKDVDFFDPVTRTGTFRYAVIRTSQDCASVSFVLNSSSPRAMEAVEKVKAYAQRSAAENILVAYVPHDHDESISHDFFVVKGSDRLLEAYLGNSFSYSAQGFFQNNHLMAEQMQAYVHRLLKAYETRDASLLDLYSGVGTFGIANARHFKSVTMVESIKECIESCQANMEMNRVTNGRAVLLDARDLKQLEFPGRLFAITDPPRSGMHPDALAHLSRLGPEAIIYISCNPVQLAKDLPRLKDYAVKSVALFDLFPQTPHSEAVVELCRRPDLGLEDI